MIKDLWKIEEILASSKGNRVACEPTEVRMDEDDIRNDLGVNKLGTRRRLLLYFDELRALQDAADEKE